MSKLQKLLTIIRRRVYQLISLVDYLNKNPDPKILIFCYHSISTDNFKYGVSINDFKQQVLFLLSKFQPISLDILRDYLEDKAVIKNDSFIIVFDDGYEDNLKVVQFLKSHKITPTLLVLADPEHADRVELGTDKKLLTWNQIRKLKDEGWIIGCHSSTHINFNKLSDEDIIREIITAKKIIEKNIGSIIYYFGYPRGNYNSKVIEQVKKAGFHLGLSMDDRIIDKTSNRYILPRIGVGRTHTYEEFKTIFSSTVIKVRGYLKNYGIERLFV